MSVRQWPLRKRWRCSVGLHTKVNRGSDPHRGYDFMAGPPYHMVCFGRWEIWQCVWCHSKWYIYRAYPKPWMLVSEQ